MSQEIPSSVQIETPKKSNQAILSYLNNVMNFEKDFKFEEYDEKKCKHENGEEKNVSVVEFKNLGLISEMNSKFTDVDESVRQEYKLREIIPTILNYKLRGILDISQQIGFSDANLDQFIEYQTKQKPIPTLESFTQMIKIFCTSDKMKIKLFNLIFPHGIHEKSMGKIESEIKGVDKIYVQKIGVHFESVLEAICKLKSESEIINLVKSLVAEQIGKTMTIGNRKTFLATINGINLQETIRILEDESQKEEQKAMQKRICGYKSEVKDWILQSKSEIGNAKRLQTIILQGLEQNGLEKKVLISYFKNYMESVQKIQSLASVKVENNADFVQFCRLVTNTGNSIFGDKKGFQILIDSKANIKQLLSHKDAKKFDEGEDLSEESIKNLFEQKKEVSRIKSIQKIINSKLIPQNLKIALGIYITNEFYEVIQKESYNKSWQRRTFYVKF